ncbi:hypothetical protein LCGC14_1637540 [marine sediment metagenome]|uniref:TROVE domain-containing protein n=2 Tax=root TaxID=1 RepID=A0A0F9L048_9ZZZZ|nr:MAG: hypothetical protein LCMAC202_01370 [Marseillevirus LCMAC202]
MDIKNLFLSDSTLTDHYTCQEQQRQEYIANLSLLTLKYHTPLSLIKQARILAAALMRNDTELCKFLLNHYKYDLPTVLKTCQILDSRRLVNQLERKTPRIKSKRKLSAHNSIISNLKSLNEGLEVSLTKSKSKVIITEWINKLSAADLEMLALQYPKGQWRKLTDLLHTRNDDFQLEWFNKYVWDKPVPDNCVVSKFAQVTEENIVALVREYKPNYSYLRSQCRKLVNDDVLAIVTAYTPMDQIFHHWEAFQNQQEQVLKRLTTEGADMPYGALMKHLQNLDTELPVAKELTRIAGIRLEEYDIDIQHPVVVLGDASSSMDVAIRTSSIITSVLCSLFDAKLHLFRTVDEPIENPPRTVQDVVKMGRELRADGCTAPGASLKPFLDTKEIVKTFIIVTDEIENTSASGAWLGNSEEWFAPLFRKYREEVYPAKLVFVSFLPDRRDGQMVTALKNLIPDIEKDLTQFILDLGNPDLRKLDDLLNKLTLETDTYQQELAEQLKKDWHWINKQDSSRCNIQ